MRCRCPWYGSRSSCCEPIMKSRKDSGGDKVTKKYIIVYYIKFSMYKSDRSFVDMGVRGKESRRKLEIT